MTVERQERRWCRCGWNFYGTESERTNAFRLHWASRNHKKAMKDRDYPVGVEIVVSKESPE